MSKPVAVVTGANKGIGLFAVRRLHKAGFDVVLTSRDESRGHQAQKDLKDEGISVDYVKLDAEDASSIESAAKYVKEKGGCDVFVNNAGIAWKGDAFDEEVAQGTLSVNYFGARRAIESFLPVIKDNGRVVVVSSRAGDFSKLSSELKARFLDKDGSIDQLDALANQFVKDVKNGDWKEKGWPKTAYGISKMAITSYVKRKAQSLPRGITIYSMCPGWCRTDMAGDKAPRTADDGADTIEYLATESASKLTSGDFYAERKHMTEWI